MKNNYLKFLFSYLLKTKKIIILAITLVLISTITRIISPIIISKILNSHLENNMGIKNYEGFKNLILLFILVYTINIISSYFSITNLHKVSNRVTKNIQNDLLKHIHNLNISFFDNNSSGTLVSRIANDSSQIRSFFSFILSNFLVAFLMLFGIFVVLIIIDLKLFFALLLLTITFTLYGKYYLKKVSKQENKMIKYRAKINSSLNENISAMPLIQSYNREEYYFNKHIDILENKKNEGMILEKIQNFGSYSMIDLFKHIGFALIIYYYGFYNLKLNSAINIGSIYILIDYISKLTSEYISIINTIAGFSRANEAGKHIYNLMKIEEENDIGCDFTDGDIEIKDLYFSYNKNEIILNGLNLKIKQNSSVAFVGHTGSGKTTLANLILRYYDNYKGEISLNNIEISKIDRKKYNENFSVVLQDPIIFTGTLYSNISLGEKYIDKDMATSALISVGGNNFLKKLDKGIDTIISEKGMSFSSGERQIISFARAFIRDPKYLILDEATSNVDSGTEKIIQNALNAVKKGRTTIIIAHRLSTIKECDMIYLLDKGEIKESGTHDSLISLNGHYKKMYDEQIAKVI